MKTAPLLSIGMIFKNESRCIERCLRSLQPLRDAIPCELIMADTGATDGSREIAEQYADEVFDFEWIDDFAAARNAVMDRCSGKWYLSIDCDEWLDKDIAELLRFLKAKSSPQYAYILMHNYTTTELEGSSSFYEFFALRLARMDTGCRYEGMVHENWHQQGPCGCLTNTILHHDGYVYADPKLKKEKLKRNMLLLRKKLEQDPENLFTVLQCMESGEQEQDYLQYTRRGVAAVQDKQKGWNIFGGCILRRAVETAYAHELPEFEEWVHLAETMFPDSIYTRVDVYARSFMVAHSAQNWEEAIRYGERYLSSMRALRNPRQSLQLKAELSQSALYYGSPAMEREVQIKLADACFNVEEHEKTLRLIAELDGRKLPPAQVSNAVVLLCKLHACSQLDVTPALTAFYDQISRPEPDEQKKKARLAAFDTIAAAAFTKNYRQQERDDSKCWRPSYTALCCLADQCEAGRAAALMSAIDPEEIRGWLAKVEDWQALPIEALEYALQEGVAFPLEEKPLASEAMSGLAARLTLGDNMARQIVLSLPDDVEYPDLQSLYWIQSLVLAAVESFDWTLGKRDPVAAFFAAQKQPDKQPTDTPETGLALIRRFAQAESAFLSTIYTPLALAEENAALLPPMHRWGLYCTRALNALDAGRPQEYLAILRKGLAACPGEKGMVQFLLDRFREDTRPKATPELLALAEKVQIILAAYGPDDPAVAAIRESPAYRQVAWLIEETPGRPVQ